jgi:putative ABC transport system permease protein
MMIKDLFKIPIEQIKHRRIRAWLTLLGIVIGIAAIVSLISLGQGLENAIEEQFSSLGNDKLIITAKGNTLTAGLSIDAIKITSDDLEVVNRVQGVKDSAGFIFTTAKVEFNDNVRYFYIFGTPKDPQQRKLIGETQSYTLANGRLLTKKDKFKAVLGYDYTKPGLFEKAIDVGDTILVQDREMKVIGFWNKIGSPPDDRAVHIPLDTYWDIFDNKDELGMMIAQTNPGEDPNKVAKDVEKTLRKFRGLKEGKEDFAIQTPEQFQEAFSIVLTIIQIVVLGIAGISLLVGGVGIMNTMYTSVLERTKEIGILKAIGAQNKHILVLFLIESGLYGLGGGLIGVVIGISLAKLIEYGFLIFVGPAFLLVEVNIPLIIATILFSFIVGCLSGLAPARRASKLNPVDSLRYE